ncbi:iron chaperone [Longivirga aurantiaca]|uniref:Iron chaperone n=1 Tax=Longivirga aurantiaca TaxID=1837743 RepID=A0ABW1T333_9ACTN
MPATPGTIDDYLAAQPDAVRAALQDIRAVVHEVLPGATERISYGMPTFDLDGSTVVHVAGWAKHVSIYPTPASPPELVEELAPLSSGRGTTKLVLKDGIDLELVRRIVRALAAERAA